MAGLGRRSHYRKHLTDSVLNDLPEPKENERIAKVTGTRGSNQFDIIVDPQSVDINEEDMKAVLAILPTKFRKLVWLKRNDYVIVQCADSDDDESGIRYMIEHILYKDQVKHLKDKNLWPKHELFSGDGNTKEGSGGGYLDEDEYDSQQESEEEEDGIVYNNVDDEYFCNMNRVAKMKIEDSSDEDSDSD